VPTERIKVGDETIEIETKPLTLVFSDGSLPKITVPGKVSLDIGATTYHADRMTKPHARLDEMLVMVTGAPLAEHGDKRGWGLGLRHVVGLLDLTLKLLDQNIGIHWAYPESALHPKWQLGLADVLLALKGEDA